MRPSASTASLEDAATALAPLRRVRVDLVDLRYAPIVRDAKGNRAPKRVIHGCTTSFLPGTVSALMGPSGSGKTSLLTVIAGFVDQSHVSGNLLVNGERTQVGKRLVGIVFQDDMMLPALTAFETVKFAADLRMPRRCSDAERTEACDAILNELGLAHVRDQLVGGAARRGVSGGERKRLAVGVELVTRPALLLMDEPTSGLDAAAALSLMRTLRTLASRGQTVVAAIHQPRTTVFDSFDHLVLMSKGHALFDGAPDGCVGHLESLGLGLTLPPRTNPADWLMDVIAADESLGEDTRKLPEGWKNAKEKRVFVVEDSDASGTDAAAGKGDDDDDGSARSEREGASVWRQLRVITVREDKSRRGQNLTAINAAQMLVMAILTAMFWWQMPDDTDAFVMERFSILFFCIIAQSNAVVFACVNTFAKERQLMIRENAKGMYHPLPFFVAKTASDTVNTLVMPCLYATVTYWCVGLKRTAEAYFVFITAFALCILVAQSLGLALSCAIPDVQVSLIVAPMVILMLMILGGFYVTFSNMPVFIRWLSWCSQARFGFTAMVVNEFSGRTFQCDPNGNHARYGTGCPVRGEDVITALEMDDLSVGQCLLALALMQVGLRIAAYVAMVVNFTRLKQ